MSSSWMSPYADSSAARDKNTRHCCMLTPARQKIKKRIPLRAAKIILIARPNSESFDAMLGCPPTTRGARSPGVAPDATGQSAEIF